MDKLMNASFELVDPYSDRVSDLTMMLRDISIYRGILTGYNEAFIIDNQTKEALIASDPSSAEILKPILRGRDIKRYQAHWARLWVIYSFSGIEIDKYPAIKQHLSQHRRALENRTGGARRDKEGNLFVPYKWYELQVDYYNSGTYKQFMRDKIVWIELVENGRFAYDDSGIYCEATTFIMTGKSPKYLCPLLNSKLIRWFLKQVAPTSGMGTLRWKKVYVETIPIPKITETEQQPLSDLADQIMTATLSTDNTGMLEAEVDKLVYALYGLTEPEIRVVESD